MAAYTRECLMACVWAFDISSSERKKKKCLMLLTY